MLLRPLYPQVNEGVPCLVSTRAYNLVKEGEQKALNDDEKTAYKVIAAPQTVDDYERRRVSADEARLIASRDRLS